MSLVGDMRAVARSYFESVSPAHDWHHVQRVEALAERLLAEHEGDADPETVRLAVLLHDIGRPREDRGVVDDHAEWGAREARRLLEERSVDPLRVDAVCHAVRVHRYSNDHEPGSPEAKLVCDADNLDALTDREFGPPLHMLVLPGDCHTLERDALVSLAGAPPAAFD